jgi:hypothetical protein
MKWYILGISLIVLIVLIKYFNIFETFQNSSPEVSDITNEFIPDLSGINVKQIIKDLSGIIIDTSTVDRRLPDDKSKVCDIIKNQIIAMEEVNNQYKNNGDWKTVRLNTTIIDELKKSFKTSKC